MQHETKLKKIPHGISKTKLKKLYATVPDKTLKDSINHIILEHRRKIKRYENLSDYEIIKTNTVYKPEFIELITEFGLPDGYEL